LHTVISFLARNGQIRAVEFLPKNFGQISYDLGEISMSANFSAEKWMKFAQIERNSLEIFEGEPKLHGSQILSHIHDFTEYVEKRLF
jgi:hypothetical protein